MKTKEDLISMLQANAKAIRGSGHDGSADRDIDDAAKIELLDLPELENGRTYGLRNDYGRTIIYSCVEYWDEVLGCWRQRDCVDVTKI